MMTFLISLAAATQRRQSAEAALADARLSYTRIEAFDGRAWPAIDPPGFGRPVSGAEQACLRSHLSALEAFLASDADTALVLEDDLVWLDARSVEAVAEWLGAQPDWDVAHLCPAPFGFRTLWGQAGGQSIWRAHLFPMRSPALLWSRSGARVFVDGQPQWPMDHAVRQMTLARASGVAVGQPLVRLGDGPSMVADRDALITPAYLARRRRRRRRQKAKAAWHRLCWRGFKR